jgi:hypothetical protein
MRHLLLLTVPALLLSACTNPQAPQTEATPLNPKQLKLVERALGGKVQGEAVQCLPNHLRHDMVRVSDTMLIYRVSGNLSYRNDLRGSCPGLARDRDIIVTRQFGSSTCSGDFFHLVDRTSGMRGPTCIFGDFIPFRKEKGS